MCLDVSMGGSTIKPRDLRNLLDAVLRTDSDLNAFCLDYFPSAYRQFSGGMDRSSKYSLLLQKEDASEILTNLRDAYPKQVSRHIHLLEGNQADTSSPDAEEEPSRMPTAPQSRTYGRDELFDALCKLLPSQFDSLLFRLNVPLALTPSGHAPQASRAAEVVRLLEQEGTRGLERLGATIKQVAPLVLP